MKSITGAFLFIFTATLFDALWAQTVHTVTVGDTGSFYIPQVTSANKGDVVVFQWTGNFHSVTQSSFNNPCTPLQGGFDSGVTGNPTGMRLVPEWNLTITDDTQPIWFFCKATVPVLHCTAGMVGAINAPIATSNMSFNNFSDAAKILNDPPAIPTGLPPSLTGIGAVATSVPIPTMNQTNVTTTTSASSTLTSTSSTTSPTPTPSVVSTHSGLSTGGVGGIAGGVVGGVIIIALIILVFLSYKRAKKYRREAKANEVLQRRELSHDMIYSDHMGQVDRLVNIHRSQGSASVVDSLERESSGGPSINVKELAAEIAKNMRMDGRGPQGLDSVPEQLVANAVSRIDSAGAAPALTTTDNTSSSSGSVRTPADASRTYGGRQLPRPPPSAMNNRKADDTRSVDTLPAYGYSQ